MTIKSIAFVLNTMTHAKPLCVNWTKNLVRSTSKRRRTTGLSDKSGNDMHYDDDSDDDLQMICRKTCIKRQRVLGMTGKL